MESTSTKERAGLAINLTCLGLILGTLDHRARMRPLTHVLAVGRCQSGFEKICSRCEWNMCPTKIIEVKDNGRQMERWIRLLYQLLYSAVGHRQRYRLTTAYCMVRART